MRTTRGALACFALSLIGMGLCVYLGFLHVALLRGELIGGLACGAAGTMFNCHAVTASPLGTVLDIPLALWGLLGYVASATLALIAWQSADWAERALTSLVALSLVFVIVDLRLLFAMLLQIRYLCPSCLASYAINLLLLLTAAWAVARPWRAVWRQIPSAVMAWRPRRGAVVVWMFWAVVLTGAGGLFAVHAATAYVSQGAPGTIEKQMAQFISQRKPVRVDIEGDPVKGAPQGSLRIVEFSDFLCPSCQRASQFNPILLAGHRQDVLLAFKHFPLDMACNTSIKRTMHPGACQIAAATECAHEQGKFWALHDRVFAAGPAYQVGQLQADAAAAGLDVEAFRSCLDSGRGMEAVKRDIAEASRLNIASTPTYVINGFIVPGLLTPTTFETFVEALRASANAP